MVSPVLSQALEVLLRPLTQSRGTTAAKLHSNALACVEMLKAEPALHVLHDVWHKEVDFRMGAEGCQWCGSASEEDVLLQQWRFCYTALLLLHSFGLQLRQAMTNAPAAERESAGLLGLADQRGVRTLLEFIVALAIQPALQQGVGVALEQRVGLQVSEHLKVLCTLGSPFLHLGLVVRALVAFLHVPALCDLVVERALLDLVGAILQMSYAPEERQSWVGEAPSLPHGPPTTRYCMHTATPFAVPWNCSAYEIRSSLAARPAATSTCTSSSASLTSLPPSPSSTSVTTTATTTAIATPPSSTPSSSLSSTTASQSASFCSPPPSSRSSSCASFSSPSTSIASAAPASAPASAPPTSTCTTTTSTPSSAYTDTPRAGTTSADAANAALLEEPAAEVETALAQLGTRVVSINTHQCSPSAETHDMYGHHWNTILQQVPRRPLVEALLMLSGRRGQAAPAWLQDITRTRLRQLLMLPGSVQAFYTVVLRAALVQEQAGPSSQDVWKQCERAATMLASCATMPGSSLLFTSTLVPQILPVLLQPVNTPGAHVSVCAAAATLVRILNLKFACLRVFVLEPLCRPLAAFYTADGLEPPGTTKFPAFTKSPFAQPPAAQPPANESSAEEPPPEVDCGGRPVSTRRIDFIMSHSDYRSFYAEYPWEKQYSNGASMDGPAAAAKPPAAAAEGEAGETPFHVLVPERDLERCLTALHRLFISNAQPGQAAAMGHVRPVLLPLFRLLCCATRAHSHLRATAEELLVTFLKTAGREQAVRDWMAWVQHDPLRGHVDFAVGESGGMTLRRVEQPEARPESDAQCAAGLLLQAQRDDVVVDCFSQLATCFGAAVMLCTAEALEGSPLVLHALLHLCDKVAPVFGRRPSEAVVLIGRLLHVEHDGIRVLSLRLLDEILREPATRPEMRVLLPLIPLLDRFVQSDSPALAAVAEHVRDILTLNPEEHAPPAGVTPAVVEEITQQLSDPIVSVRAHALMRLQELVLAKDPVLLQMTSALVELFLAQLQDTDSYLFLTAIDGLASLARVSARDVIPTLTAAYRNADSPVETRLKIGESLLRITKMLNELLPHYFTLLFPTMLLTCRDKNELMRTSALSVLAEGVCNHAFAFSTFLEEVILCASSLARSDKQPQVRRGAVHLLCYLLRGLHANALALVQSHMTPLRQLLVVMEDSDPDDITRCHARTALVEMDAIVKRVFKLTPSS